MIRLSFEMDLISTCGQLKTIISDFKEVAFENLANQTIFEVFKRFLNKWD